MVLCISCMTDFADCRWPPISTNCHPIAAAKLLYVSPANLPPMALSDRRAVAGIAWPGPGHLAICSDRRSVAIANRTSRQMAIGGRDHRHLPGHCRVWYMGHNRSLAAPICQFTSDKLISCLSANCSAAAVAAAGRAPWGSSKGLTSPAAGRFSVVNMQMSLSPYLLISWRWGRFAAINRSAVVAYSMVVENMVEIAWLDRRSSRWAFQLMLHNGGDMARKSPMLKHAFVGDFAADFTISELPIVKRPAG